MLKSTCMMKYDSRSSRYKLPFGGVNPGDRVRFFAETQRQDIDIFLRLWVDDHEVMIRGERIEGGVEFYYTPEHTGIVWYYFVIYAPEGCKYYSSRGGEGRMYDYPPDSYQLTVYDKAYSTPEWFRRGVVYQIFPDRFFRNGEILGLDRHRELGHEFTVHESWEDEPDYLPLPGKKHYSPTDFFGGNLWGIAEKLPYIASLGVNCIYLNPIGLSDSNHRYNTADYMEVDPILGGNEALKHLAAEAGKYNIRLMLDGVFSHTGDDSVYFDKYHKFGNGACSNPNSPYREWFSFREYPDKYRSWWGFETLPEVEEMTPSYMEFVAGVLDRYARDGITSWRLDVADELPDEFIEFIRTRVKENDPEGALLGEVWEEASNKQAYGRRRRYVDGHELDSVMGYPFRGAMIDFLLERIDGAALADWLLCLMEYYPEPFYYAHLNLMGSHDEVRPITALAGAPRRGEMSREQQAEVAFSPEEMEYARNRFMLAAAVQYTMPGVPCLYYGDEAGMCGMADPFNRGAYPWGREDTDLVSYFQALGRLRHTVPGLTEKGCAMWGSGNVFALWRQGAVTIVNRGKKTRLTLDPEAFAGDMAVELSGCYRDVLSGIRYENLREAIVLPAETALMLIRE